MKTQIDAYTKKSQISDLYVVPPLFKKEAGSKMPPNSELWGESIFGVFSEQYPELAELSSGDVEWDSVKLDDEAGFGVGTIVVNSGSSIVKIPIVVKDFYLQPIDIFEHSGKMKLLNNENIGAALKEQDSLGDVSYPAKSRFLSSEFTTWLSKGASEESWKHKFDDFSKFAQKEAGPYTDRPLQILGDVKIVIPKENMSVFLEKSGTIGELVAVYYSRGEIVKIGELNFADPEVRGIEEMKEAATLAFNAGSAICKLGEIPDSNVGFLDVDATEDLDIIDEAGVYEVEQVVTSGLKGVLAFAVNIVPLGQELNPEEGNKIFIVESDEGLNYSLQDSVVGKSTNSSKFKFDDAMVPLEDAARYDKGILLYGHGTNVDQCSELVKIERVEATPKGKIRIFMKTNAGDVHYLINDDFKKVMILSDVDPMYSSVSVKNLTGPNLPLLKVNEIVELVSSLDKHQMFYNNAVINAAKEGAQMIVSARDGNITGRYEGRTFEDSPDRFMARMVSLGVGPEKTAALLQHVLDEENAKPVTVVGIKVGSDNAPNVDGMVINEIVALANGMKVDLVKAAAAIEAGTGEQDTAAAVLGLGMLDEENVRYFIQLIPILEDTNNTLAKMLYSARIEAVDIDEGAIKSALLNITKIVGRLRELSSGI